MDSARKRAEEALAFMDAALRDEMPPLPTQVKALADSVRALLASEPAKAPFVSRNEEWGLRPDFTTAGVTAPPAGAEVREAAERLRASLVAVPSWEALLPKNCGACEGESDCAGKHEPCGCHETLAVIEASLALLSALRDAASPAPGNAEVREAAEELQRIDNLLARRITLDGLTRVQKIALALRVCEETDPKGEVAARYVCRGGAKGGGR